MRNKAIIPQALFFLIALNTLGQSNFDNLKKYWYYRWRYVNDFTIVGSDKGGSLPINERKFNKTVDIKYGDETIALGYYLGVLATEYKLLKNNNKPVLETIKEIYYALEAFNRIDYYTETYTDGIYLIVIRIANKYYYQKIVKQH